jgi:hypothetical protein
MLILPHLLRLGAEQHGERSDQRGQQEAAAVRAGMVGRNAGEGQPLSSMGTRRLEGPGRQDRQPGGCHEGQARRSEKGAAGSDRDAVVHSAGRPHLAISR